MQPEPRSEADIASAARDLDRADPNRNSDGLPRLPNGMLDMEKLTDGVIRNDGTADQEKLRAIEERRAAGVADPPAAPVPAKPQTPAEMIANFRPPDLNVPGLPPLPAHQLPPAKLTAYVFPPEPGAPVDAEVMRMGVEARAWMQQGGFPVDLGNFVAGELGGMTRDYSGGADGEWETNMALTESKLSGMWGADVYQARKEQLSKLVDHLDRKFEGRVSAFLDANPGILLNVRVLGHLMLHAERMKGRLR